MRSYVWCLSCVFFCFFFFSSRRRHTRWPRDWSSDVCSSDLRARTGEGQWIDASQSEVGLFISGTTILDWSANGRIWTRYCNRSPYKPAAPHGVYPCAGDDRWLTIACFMDAEWRALTEVAGHPEWANDGRFKDLAGRLAHQDALDALVGGWTKSRDAYEAMLALQRAGVPAGVCQ